MVVIFLLIAVSMLMALSFLMAYIWADRSGQFEDDYTPSVRILYDDQIKPSDSCQIQTTRKSPDKP